MKPWELTPAELEAAGRDIEARQRRPPTPRQQRMLDEMDQEAAAGMGMSVEEYRNRFLEAERMSKNPQLEAALQKLEAEGRQREEMKRQAGLGVTQPAPQPEPIMLEPAAPEPTAGGTVMGGAAIAGAALKHGLGKVWDGVAGSGHFHAGLADLHAALEAVPRQHRHAGAWHSRFAAAAGAVRGQGRADGPRAEGREADRNARARAGLNPTLTPRRRT